MGGIDYIEKILKSFAMLLQHDVRELGEEQAALNLLEMLEKGDPYILTTKDGPMFYALADYLGLLGGGHNQSRVNQLNPEIAAQLVLAWGKFRLRLLNLLEEEQTENIFHVSESQ